MTAKLLFAKETARKYEHHRKHRVKTTVVRGGDKPWGLWSAKYWKTKPRRGPRYLQGTYRIGAAQEPECFSSAPVNHAFLIEYAKRMFFCASADTVHTL